MLNNKIAIIGLSCRYGAARNGEDFWAMIKDGRSVVRRYSAEEMSAMGHTRQRIENPQFVPVGSIIEGATQFDNEFFGFSPLHAELLDPQQRLLLEGAWHAMEDAGYVPERCDYPVSVYVSVGQNTLYTPVTLADLDAPGFFRFTGNDKDFAATRISYKLGFTGPSLSVQTACSSSLVATHLACESLINEESDMALVGAASLHFPAAGYIFSRDLILSQGGVCRPFSDDADGTVFGHGMGWVVLKRLDDAIQDNDMIYAVICGSAVNNDGSHKNDYYAPSAVGQRNVIEDALAVAGLTAEDIGYVETHGTGTKMGDPIEIAGLNSVFSHTKNQKVYLGAVKANIGHCNTAAGMAGLLKGALMLKYKTIPPQINVGTVNQNIDLSVTPFAISESGQPWQLNEKDIRRMGISSFGIGGTNAHVILEEPPKRQLPSNASVTQLLFPFSARNEQQLTQLLQQFLAFVRRSDLRCVDIAYSLQHGRAAFEHRIIFMASGLKELCINMSHYLQHNVLKNVWHSAGFTPNPSMKLTVAQQQSYWQQQCWDELAKVWCSGFDIDWDHMPGIGGQHITLPGYPFAPVEWPLPVQSDSQTILPDLPDLVAVQDETQISQNYTLAINDILLMQHRVGERAKKNDLCILQRVCAMPLFTRQMLG